MKPLRTCDLILADMCARKWRKIDKAIDIEDYYQEACCALVVANKRYNNNKNTKFSSYAFIVMDGAIKNMLSKHHTGYKEGFVRKYPVPAWVYLDNHVATNEDDVNNYDIFLGGVANDFELREELFDLDIILEKPINNEEQKQIASFSFDIKNKLKQYKISIDKLAKEIGTTQSTLSRWLNNDVRLTKERQKLITNALKELTNEPTRSRNKTGRATKYMAQK